MREKCIWNSATCSYENDKYIRSMIDDSMITYDEIIEEKKLLQQICDIKYVLLAYKNQS